MVNSLQWFYRNDVELLFNRKKIISPKKKVAPTSAARLTIYTGAVEMERSNVFKVMDMV